MIIDKLRHTLDRWRLPSKTTWRRMSCSDPRGGEVGLGLELVARWESGDCDFFKYISVLLDKDRTKVCTHIEKYEKGTCRCTCQTAQRILRKQKLQSSL
jgi:hypothetical protein